VRENVARALERRRCYSLVAFDARARKRSVWK
jgi:hypothetical protein